MTDKQKENLEKAFGFTNGKYLELIDEIETMKKMDLSGLSKPQQQIYKNKISQKFETRNILEVIRIYLTQALESEKE